MAAGNMTVLIMAAGTGGHVFPALSIARALRARAMRVEWLGTPRGMENELLADTDIPLHRVSVSGLRGVGSKRLLRAPIMLVVAFFESFKVLNQVKPDCVIGMGGFVCGPAGLACWLQRRPLLIHEQNAVAGLTNRILARFATRVFEAFRGTFRQQPKVQHTGNPLRSSIVTLAAQPREQCNNACQLRLLVLGGSRGAQAINRLIPEVILHYQGDLPLHTLHQTGAADIADTRERYRSAGIAVGDCHRVVPFIADMAAAYAWADMALCRAGAGTVSELAAVGLPAIFIPYPHHQDQQQTRNANCLVESGAAWLIPQHELGAARLVQQLQRFGQHRHHWRQMALRARSQAVLDADQRIVNGCLEVLHAR